MEFDPNEPRPGRFHEEHYNPFKKSSPAMLSAALLLSILSIIFCWMIYIAVPLAAVSIILALLSRGGTPKINRRARNIIITAAVGLILSVSITGYAFYTVYSNPEMKEQLDRTVEYYLRQYYGNNQAKIDSLLQNPETENETETDTDSAVSPSHPYTAPVLPWETPSPEIFSSRGDFV